MHIMAGVMRNDTGFNITNFTLQQDKRKIYSDKIILHNKSGYTVGDISRAKTPSIENYGLK